MNNVLQFLLSQFVFLALILGLQSIALSTPETPELFFETKIRPLLIDRCISCHSDKEPKGGLSLESRQGWADREVIVPGEPVQSSLIKAVRFQDADLKMPPEDSGIARLSENDIQLLERWIREGAADPRTSNVMQLGPKLRPREFNITQQDLDHWSFQPIRALAKPSGEMGGSSTIDQLIDDKLKSMGIGRSSHATPRELVRRAYFDLWGLPPDPNVVAEFQRDPSDSAWNALIDKLLASPHYGERWGRHWLDWVRFAETNGYERDGIKQNAWRYRDYVIQSFNNDKPYDRFLSEQLAGDLLISEENLTYQQSPELWKEAIIATGYYRLHVWDDEPDSSAAAELDDLDDIMVTTGAAMMGLTIGCCRCHDHKFDPFSQVDYYSMLDLFRDIDPYGLLKTGGGGRGTGRIERFLCADEELDRWRVEHKRSIEELETKIASATDSEKSEIEKDLKELRNRKPPFDRALAINPPLNGPKATFVLNRGDYQSPLQQVTADVPQLFEKLNSMVTTQKGSDDIGAGAVKTRLEFARWLTSSKNPLTSRVLSNRIWLHHFGAGIVPTPDDFGYTGVAPNHMDLLDYLSSELMRGGWSIKRLHRLIMNSQTYRMSSHAQPSDNPAALRQDPDNNLFWRQNYRRLDAEALRDSMLVYAGEMTEKSSGPSVYSNLSPEVRETANPVSLADWMTSPENQQNCRSVFLMVKRSLKEPLLESFDFPNSNSSVGPRPITTVAPQALMLLNDRFVHQRAENVAQRLMEQFSELDQRIDRLWQLVYQREPSTQNRESVSSYVHNQISAKQNELTIWASVVRAVLNSNECIHVD